MNNNTKKPPISSLAVVLPRYGESLGGGAEALTKALIEKAVLQWPGIFDTKLNVEIWTTCAIDHRTWENKLPEGETIENGLIVRRFTVDERNLDAFIFYELSMQEKKQLSVDEQLEWLANSVNSTSLYRHIAEHGRDFDRILFAPYLFATTFWGSLIYPDRSVLIPCLHNEAYAYLDVFRVMFKKVSGLLFNTQAEYRLAEELYGSETVCGSKSSVVGMGFEAIDENSQNPWKWEFSPGSYLLYSGRKEKGKNLDLLINYIEGFRKDNAESDLKLVIIGAGDISFIETLPNYVYDLGFVSESEKHQLMRESLALCQPSINESFSIVIMEAWLNRTPIIVHSNCAVTREHVEKSGGGLHFSDATEFSAVLSCLQKNRELREGFAIAGLRYVEDEYNWQVVIKRFIDALTKISTLRDALSTPGEEIIGREGLTNGETTERIGADEQPPDIRSQRTHS